MKKYRGVFIKNDNEIASMREANRITAIILDELGKAVQPGIATSFFDEIARDCCARYAVKPAFLGYGGFPHALCCSVNDEVVHGFPSSRKLQEGDIVSFDMGVIFEGFYGDSARTFAVGTVSEAAQKLMDITRESLNRAIEVARVGNSLKDIGLAVQNLVEPQGYSVIRRFVGHGIGRSLHEKPEIPNFYVPGMPDLPLQVGMVLAIEPMVAIGTHDVDILADEWTAVTRDGSLAAHYEHTIAITQNGPEILSLP